jgi:hypothetical protein
MAVLGTQKFKSKEDCYVMLAAEFFGVEPEDVTTEQRRMGKELVMAMVYNNSIPPWLEFHKRHRAMKAVEIVIGPAPLISLVSNKRPHSTVVCPVQGGTSQAVQNG